MSIHINNHIKQWSKSDNVEEQERKVAFLQKLANDGNFPKNKFEAMELYLAEYGTEEEQKEHQDHYRGGIDIEKLKAQFSSTSEENESPKSHDKQRKHITSRTVRNVVSDPSQRPPRFSIHTNNHIKQWSKSDNQEEQEHKAAFLENLAKEDKFPRNKFEALELYYAEHGTKEQQEEHANSRKEFIPKEKEIVSKPIIREERPNTTEGTRKPARVERPTADPTQRPPRFSIHTNNHIKQWSKSDNQEEQEQKAAFLEKLAQEDKFPRNKFQAMELFYAEHGGERQEEQVQYTHKNGSSGVDIEKLKAQFSTTTTARDGHVPTKSSSSSADRQAASKHLSGQTVRNLLSRNEKFDTSTQQRRKSDSTQHKDHMLPIFCCAGKLCGYRVNYHLSGNLPTFCDNALMKHDIPSPNKRVNHSISWNTVLCAHCRSRSFAPDDLPVILSEFSCTACHAKLHCGVINQFGVILH